MARNYKKETKWESSPEQKKKRAARGRARYKLMKEGKVKKGDGKEVDHKNLNPLDNSKDNLQVLSKTANRKKQPKHKGRK